MKVRTLLTLALLFLLLLTACNKSTPLPGGYDQVSTKIVEPGVLSLEVPAVREDTIPFALQFTGTPAKPAMRPFAAGPVGEVK